LGCSLDFTPLLSYLTRVWAPRGRPRPERVTPVWAKKERQSEDLTGSPPQEPALVAGLLQAFLRSSPNNEPGAGRLRTGALQI
jgi:hypothetical protein